MANTTYYDKLKDPRWQKKRLEIFERDGWKCRSCSDSESTLVVHHRYYENIEPWEYPDEALITLCENCHEQETNLTIIEKSLLRELRIRFLTDDISRLTVGFHEMTLCHAPEVVASVLEWVLSSEEIQRELIARFFEYTSKELRVKEVKNNG